MTRVKICGITNLDDALAAVECGADALGFNFAAGPRKIAPSLAREIIVNLPPFAAIVGVFIGEDLEITTIADDCGIQVIQLHGGESEEFARRLASCPDPVEACGSGERILRQAQDARLRPIIRVIHASDESAIEAIPKYASASAILLDASVPGKLGGTGRTFDWEIAIRAKEYGKPLVLAGGLNPANVAQAVTKVRPYAVDVASGVESSPGKKDHKLMKEFIQNVRALD